MKSKSIALLGVVFGAVLSASAVAPVSAAVINTSTLACQPVNAPQTDIRHTENGVSTEGIAPARFVTCSVPRSPLITVGTSGAFVVTGDNIDGRATTSCTLSSYEFTGTFLGSASFTSSTAHYAVILTLPVAQLPYWAYTSMTCLLPENARATLESVISVPSQPTTNINTNASECQTTFWPQDAVVHSERGVSTASNIESGRYVTCTVLRSPLASGATTGSFYVDGDNVNGAATTCAISSYDYTGAFLGSASFSTFAATYDQFLTLPSAQLGYWAYTSMTCVIPPHGNGTLRGVTSIQ